ncbi:hypothetical protein CYLTODRAFT_483059 [Cylindrobasidium torrendii FP15055 ss-10]|uniref:Uncharacterized protein n=1 Tax=Cylindrobasidium torrendii FP15055 ss-10 TaxID=1314674 RepID=A0A0D7BEA5_9AGAR|nr:hypothetical protein CYLTODRAFT_483059 [Cylindrobasidium torrendii FP15055 ss-10]
MAAPVCIAHHGHCSPACIRSTPTIPGTTDLESQGDHRPPPSAPAHIPLLFPLWVNSVPHPAQLCSCRYCSRSFWGSRRSLCR